MSCSPETGSDQDRDFTSRLAKFGLEAGQIEWFDLVLQPDLRLELDAQNPRLGCLVQTVPIRSLEQFQNCLGVPRGAQPIYDQALPFVPSYFLLDEHYPDEEQKFAELIGRTVLGDQANFDDALRERLDAWILQREATITVALLRDIYVANRAQLTLNEDVLFARHITIERGGQITIRGNRHTKVDCSGIGTVFPVVLKTELNAEILLRVS
jgi:hypothetical protein